MPQFDLTVIPTGFDQLKAYRLPATFRLRSMFMVEG